MKILHSAVIFYVAFSAYLTYTSAYDHYKREANPLAFADPEAEPGVAKKVATFCNETMSNSTSPKDFCKIVSRKIVEKVNHMCIKAVKFTCKVFSGDTKKHCKLFLYSHLCPTVKGITEVPDLSSAEIENVDDEDGTLEIPKDVVARKALRRRRSADASPSLERYTTKRCEAKMTPVYKQIEDNGDFEYVKFCKNMRAVIKESCMSSMEEMCSETPWKPVQFVCREYLSPWLCK